ncbi:chemosensory receptor C [Elysia marginata]|uniref:Chemosensory receptor C n=1 Tax=Elysia marginata TaxID=1093978 RepID=A0AAV4JHH4_9GAST|nr:chemosensory receptor C [Elysia marginata]
MEVSSLVLSSSSPGQNTHRTPTASDGFDFTTAPFRRFFHAFFDIAAPLSVLLLLFGVVANILNIIVFTKIGVKDNVTVSFLALTVSDLTHLVLMSPHIVVSTMEHFLVKFGVSIKWLFDPLILRNPFYWYAFVFYETSILITVYISVVRCACVAMPLKVKTTFTVRRAIIAFITFFLCVALLRVPMFMSRRIVREFDQVSNASRVVYKEIDDGGLADMVNDIVSRNILTWASFIVVIACVVVMVTKLRASARFRSSASASKPDTRQISSAGSDDLNSTRNANHDLSHPQNVNTIRNAELHAVPPVKTKELAVENANLPNKRKDQVLSSRESQVVRSVVLVAAVFITCQFPFMAYSLVRRFESQFDATISERGIPKFIYLFAFCANLSKLFSIMNASVNIFVYYNFNSRYRQCMKTLRK